MKRAQGFTIVELLIVILVIGILATIVVVSYNGITRRATETTLKADLRSGASQITHAATAAKPFAYPNPSLPSTVQATVGNTFQYASDGKTYCLMVTSNKAGIPTYHITNEDIIKEGRCAINLTVPVLAVTQTTNNSISLSWTASPLATSYSLQYANDSAFTDDAGSYGTANTSRVITSLPENAERFFRVKAVSEMGESVWSNTVSDTAAYKFKIGSVNNTTSPTNCTGSNCGYYMTGFRSTVNSPVKSNDTILTGLNDSCAGLNCSTVKHTITSNSSSLQFYTDLGWTTTSGATGVWAQTVTRPAYTRPDGYGGELPFKLRLSTPGNTTSFTATLTTTAASNTTIVGNQSTLIVTRQ